MFAVSKLLQVSNMIDYYTNQAHFPGHKMIVFEQLPPKRSGEKLMSYVKNAQYQRLDPNGSKRNLLSAENSSRLRADDIVTIIYKDQKPITGQILAIKRQGISSNILIRNKVGGVGVDISVPLFHPNILRVDIVRRPIKYRPRAKHYYIKGSRLDVGDINKTH